MLIAILGNRSGSVRRDVEFSCGVFAADGIGEVTIRELREFEAARQLEWVCPICASWS